MNASELDQLNYLILLGKTELDEQRELGYLTAMQRNHVAGIILLGCYYSPQLARAFKACRVPLVVTGQRFPEVPCVYNDDRSVARELAQRMLACGHRRLAYIGGTEKDQAVGLARRQGVQDALNAAGLDGVVCVTDTVALGAMRALRAAGRAIGTQVSLAGIGDSWVGGVVEPGLTTVRFYQKQVGVEAARMLLQMLEHPENGGPVRQTTLGYSVVDRGSIRIKEDA